MKPSKLYKRQRFPPEIIQYAVWLYHRFKLSYRDLEGLLAERGINVSEECLQTLQCHSQRAAPANATLLLGPTRLLHQ
jgi:transposase-like protein